MDYSPLVDTSVSSDSADLVFSSFNVMFSSISSIAPFFIPLLIIGLVYKVLRSIFYGYSPFGSEEEEEVPKKLETEIESALRIAEKSNNLSKEIRNGLTEIEKDKKKHYKKWKKFELTESYVKPTI